LSHSAFAPVRKVVAAYAVVAFLWILLSDRAVDLLFPDTALRAMAQTSKGWFFVFVTTVLLYVMLMRVHRRMHQAAQHEIEALQREARTSLLLRTLSEHSPDAIYVKDTEGRYQVFNEEACRITSHRLEEVIGFGDEQVFSPEQARKIKANDQQVMRRGHTQTFEEVVDTAAGQRTFQATKGLLRQDGLVVGMFGISRDISEMVAVRRALEQNEKRYRKMFEANPQPMWVCDLESQRFLAVNDAAVAHYGFSRDEFLSMAQDGIHPPVQLTALHQDFSRGERGDLSGQKPGGSWLHRCKDGRLIEVEISQSDIEFEGLPARIVLALDVSTRNRFERERDSVYRQLKDVLSRVTDAFYSVGPDRRFNYVNDKGALLSGHPSPAHLLGRLVPEVFPALVGSEFQTAYQRAVHSGQSAVVEGWYEPRQGWMEMRIYPSDQGVSVYVSDISRRKGDEQAQRQLQQELSELTRRLMEQERESHSRIAQALHDQLGQQLGSARLYLDVALMHLTDSNPEARQVPLARVSSLLDGAITEVRHVLRDMRPPLLEDQGLAAALDNELRSSPAQGLGLRAEFEVGSAVAGLRWADTVEFAVFMVAREAIGNALRHAQASFVKVSLDGDAAHLRLRVEDDGHGIHVSDLAGRPGHLGLVGMRERAAAIGAHLTVASGMGGGTVVELTREAHPE
jgi:PAS domain S-box-containing protein